MSRWAEPRGMLHIIHIPAMQWHLIACILHPQGRWNRKQLFHVQRGGKILDLCTQSHIHGAIFTIIAESSYDRWRAKGCISLVMVYMGFVHPRIYKLPWYSWLVLWSLTSGHLLWIPLYCGSPGGVTCLHVTHAYARDFLVKYKELLHQQCESVCGQGSGG